VPREARRWVGAFVVGLAMFAIGLWSA